MIRLNADFSNNKNPSFDVVNPSDLESKPSSETFNISMDETSGYQNNNWYKPAKTDSKSAYVAVGSNALLSALTVILFSVLFLFFPFAGAIGFTIAVIRGHTKRALIYIAASIIGFFLPMFATLFLPLIFN